MYLSIPKIAEQIDISGNTVRRYIKRFNEHFQDFRIKSRVREYGGDAVEKIRSIHTWYNENGLDRETIREKLKKYHTYDAIPDTPINEVRREEIAPYGNEPRYRHDITPDTTRKRLDHIEKKLDTIIELLSSWLPENKPDVMPEYLDLKSDKTTYDYIGQTPDDTESELDDFISRDTEPEPQEDRPDIIDDMGTELDLSEVEEIPNCHERNISNEERDQILFTVNELYPGPRNSKKRVEILNAAGVPLKGERGIWTQKKFTDNLNHARKRMV